MPERQGAVTRLLQAAASGDPHASDKLLPIVYASLRQLARQRMSKEQPGQTIGPTALVHEAYLRLVKDGAEWENRRHFFAAAAEAMRRILIERARRKQRIRHGGHLARAPYREAELAEELEDEQLLALSEALDKLERYYPRKAQIVKLRYFVGLGNKETAELIGMSLATVKADWAFSRAWLQREVARLTPVPRATGVNVGHVAT